jgi:hypothetical protein
MYLLRGISSTLSSRTDPDTFSNQSVSENEILIQRIHESKRIKWIGQERP